VAAAARRVPAGPRQGHATDRDHDDLARPAEIASIIVELHELSSRQQQVTQLLVRGLAIDEIAQTLWPARHTVRDHVKAIFAKVGVTSRPELMAKLFAEQFLPDLETKQPTTT
jgi:DNA-binding NarL/FixJ family response regulator